jgi:hypothetical protein
MVFPIIGAALGAVQLVGGLVSQNRQANAQQASLQAQANSVKTQEHLTKLQVKQQRELTQANTRLQASTLSAQRGLALLEVDNQETQARIAQVQQEMALDQRRFEDEQRATLAQSQALIQQAGELQQLEQASQQANAQQLELIEQIGGRQVREANRGAATVGTDSDLASAEREALGLGEVVQGITELVGEGVSAADAQAAYEQAIALGLLDLDRIQGDVTAESLERSAQLDALQVGAGRDNIESQFERNSQALQSATATEMAQLELATSSADVQSAAQQSALSAQSRGIQRPGFLGVVGALGNAALGAYDAYRTVQSTRPQQVTPVARTSPVVGGGGLSGTNTFGAGQFAASLVPGNTRTVPPQPGAGLTSLGLIPSR